MAALLAVYHIWYRDDSGAMHTTKVSVEIRRTNSVASQRAAAAAKVGVPTRNVVSLVNVKR